MPSISNDQLEAIAQSLSDIGAQAGHLRLQAIHAGTPASDAEMRQLYSLSLRLSDLASTFALEAAEVTLADATAAAAQVRSATDQANRALDRLKSIDKAISIASAVVTLATAVMTADPGQIAGAAKDVFTASIS